MIFFHSCYYNEKKADIIHLHFSSNILHVNESPDKQCLTMCTRYVVLQNIIVPDLTSHMDQENIRGKNIIICTTTKHSK